MIIVDFVIPVNCYDVRILPVGINHTMPNPYINFVEKTRYRIVDEHPEHGKEEEGESSDEEDSVYEI